MRNMDVGVLLRRTTPTSGYHRQAIFEAFIDINGYYTPGTRFVVEVEDDKIGILKTLVRQLLA